uniref:Uncharacterized protein n=1 Tax=Opuntia streptacantha TaxID=393608 RepID=A0A7C9EJ59_OPUST
MALSLSSAISPLSSSLLILMIEKARGKLWHTHTSSSQSYAESEHDREPGPIEWPKRIHDSIRKLSPRAASDNLEHKVQVLEVFTWNIEFYTIPFVFFSFNLIYVYCKQS